MVYELHMYNHEEAFMYFGWGNWSKNNTFLYTYIAQILKSMKSILPL